MTRPKSYVDMLQKKILASCLQTSVYFQISERNAKAGYLRPCSRRLLGDQQRLRRSVSASSLLRSALSQRAESRWRNWRLGYHAQRSLRSKQLSFRQRSRYSIRTHELRRVRQSINASRLQQLEQSSRRLGMPLVRRNSRR